MANGQQPSVYERVLPVFLKARHCTQCYRDVCLNVPLPDRRYSGASAAIMFVLERPGRKGTGTTGLVSPCNPDQTARAFKELLASAGIPRATIFITNAVLCYPDTPRYKDTPPRPREIRNCLRFLKDQLEVVRPRLLVPVGGTALRALQLLLPESTTLRQFRLKDSIGTVARDVEPWVYPVYHTSARAQVHRPLELQKEDWAKIPRIVRKASARG